MDAAILSATGRGLVETPFRDMLPDSIRDDPQFVAASQVLDGMFAELDEKVDVVLLWSRIDEMEEPLLSNLAFQLHLDGYEGWHMAETVEQKRGLVRDSIMLHWHKGTRSSLERIFEILDMRGKVVEWFEAPEDPTFRPYEFDLDVEVTRPMDEDLFYDIFSLTDALKNVRSHRRRTRIIMTSRGKVPVLVTTTYGGEIGRVWPFLLENINMAADIPRIIVGYQAIWEVYLYPISSGLFTDDSLGNVMPKGKVYTGLTDPLFDVDLEGNITLKPSVIPGTENDYFSVDKDGNVILKG